MRPSRVAPFARLVTASGLSNVADGIFLVALPLVTLGVTRDPAAFASVTLVGRLPWLFFALPAGALADRLDRRRTMTLVDVGRAALIGALAVVVSAGWEELWMLYLIAFALGTGETLFDTAAQSILPGVVVDPDQLAKANGRLYVVELTANQFIGPPLGGLLAGVALAGALGASAAAYLFAAGILLLLVGNFRPERAGPNTRIRTDIVEGARYLAGHRVLRTMALCTGLSNLASTAMMAVFALYAVDPGPLHLSESAYGILLTAGAIGAVIGSAMAAPVERALGRTTTLAATIGVFSLTLFAPAFTTNAWLVGALSVLGGASVIWNVITVSLRQRIAPDALLGRVNAGYRLLAWGTMPLGAALGGVLGDWIGLRATFWVAGFLNLLCVPLLYSGVSDRAIDAAEAAAHDDGASPTDPEADRVPA
jgi:MFS family permease